MTLLRNKSQKVISPVADKSRRPLYYLQAEDLGINASQLGPKIKKVFEMATEWDAVILLDGKCDYSVGISTLLTVSQKPMSSWQSVTQVILPATSSSRVSILTIISASCSAIQNFLLPFCSPSDTLPLSSLPPRTRILPRHHLSDH